jgi:AcrR family transcriptional regulator
MTAEASAAPDAARPEPRAGRRARPANRPSRRDEIVRAALDLFVVQPWELVTVAGIVARAGMTSAAFYYHFSSREQLLEEIVSDFADQWTERSAEVFEGVATVDGVPTALLDQLDWIASREREATVFFVTSPGATQAVEELRQQARAGVATATSRALRRVWRGRSAAERDVAALTLTVLLESAARSQLCLDEAYRVLGPRGFRDQVVELARRVLGG